MKDWYWKTFFIVLAMAVIIWGIAIVSSYFLDYYISDDSVAITVIGVVAGIVVIGNYAQVNEIKKDLYDKIKDVEKRQDEIVLQAMGDWKTKQVRNYNTPADNGISERDLIKSKGTEIKEPQYPVEENNG